MRTNYGTCLNVLLLGIFLTASAVFSESPGGGEVAETMSLQGREALAEAIPRREVELALRQREDVLAEVKQKIHQKVVR